MSVTPKILPHLSFSILFALSARPTHGYELMRRIGEDSGAAIVIGPGALYTTLKQLAKENLIQEIPFESYDNRRKYYSLTRNGLERLQAHLSYLEHIVELSKERNNYSL